MIRSTFADEPPQPQLDDDGERTVDRSHPTDLGFLRMADAFAELLRPVLWENSGSR